MEWMSYSPPASPAVGLLCLIIVTECVQGFNAGGQGCGVRTVAVTKFGCERT